MIESHELKNRDRYLKKLIGFQDTEPVKVITGIRRCGKSVMLELIKEELTAADDSAFAGNRHRAGTDRGDEL